MINEKSIASCADQVLAEIEELAEKDFCPSLDPPKGEGFGGRDSKG
jgi:hypothetical protein